MARLTLSTCIAGAAFVGLIVGPDAGAAADAPHKTPHASGRGVSTCTAREPSPDRDQSRPPQPHPIDEAEQPPDLYPLQPARPSRQPAGSESPALSSSRPQADRDSVRAGARQFIDLIQQGRVQLLNETRDRLQMEALSLDGRFQWPLPLAPVGRATHALPNVGSSDPAAIVDAPPPPESGSNAVPKKPIASSQPIRPISDTRAPDPADTEIRRRDVMIPMVTEPPPAMLQMLNTLAQRSTPQKPLAITSLLRAPYRSARFPRASAGNPHSLGLAADIVAFGGHRILSQNAEETVQAFLAIVKALPPGRFRMGVPKAPPSSAPIEVAPDAPDAPLLDNPLSDGDFSRDRGHALPSRGMRRQDDRRPRSKPPGGVSTDSSQSEDLLGAAQTATPWPFFPPPRTQIDVRGRSTTLFANEHYAAEEFLNDARLRGALVEARRHGVDVFALFPDGDNHIHIDVRQLP